MLVEAVLAATLLAVYWLHTNRKHARLPSPGTLLPFLGHIYKVIRRHSVKHNYVLLSSFIKVVQYLYFNFVVHIMEIRNI